MQKKKHVHALLLITALILLVYSNTFQSSWQFDDEPNILLNNKLHISKLTFEQINRAMRAHPSSSPEGGKLYRPIPCLTFGLNWYFGQDNVLGYHIVNIAIHILTAWLLFLTLRLLLCVHYKNKNKKKYPPEFFTTAALLAALFWALAPIQTQAVTYIVQRMASMAAMFVIAAIYTYLRGRTATNKKGLWFLLCLLFFFAALGSKENAIMLLPSLVLIELTFFKHQITRKQIIGSTAAISFLLIVAALFVHYGLGYSPFSFSSTPFKFLEGYGSRSFTFSERILTQPRILLMYLSQIFFPSADRLSFDHNIILSTSLFSPWTTLPSIAIIVSLIGGSLAFLRKYPLICFPIIFYFLNHVVESSIFALELVFEHRNYLPSLFLFLPFGVLIARTLYGIPNRSTSHKAIAMACATFFLIISGHATYTRNKVWATEGTLWNDAIKKAPNSARAARYLGKWYEKLGQDELAYRYLQRSLAYYKTDPRPEYAKRISLNQIGTLHYDRNENEKALSYFNRCLDSNKYTTNCLRNRVLVFLRLNQPEDALRDVEILIHQYPSSVAYRYLSALASYQDKSFDAALKMLKTIKDPFNDHQVMQLTGLIFLKKHDYQKSLSFLRRAEEIFPSLENKINLAVLCYILNQQEVFDKILHVIFKNYPKEEIVRIFREDRNKILNDSILKYFNSEFTKLTEKNSSVQNSTHYGLKVHRMNCD
ncbi:MAG: hypothetical protein D3919_10135 [Candidatus Electrothrix sp. AW5]|nr:hypothetical protein [Candidatus Electrothrix gigas]